ncbi:SsgA family sporulation/cell division regulator [Amycolatopsis sp. NPDC049868]|uniref:SsgA family sporulation/cell division regulator n=1 Tax=Amycolatopsis sp. NPDC049868 TaxID=3363934 RepID=UPI00378D3DDB
MNDDTDTPVAVPSKERHVTHLHNAVFDLIFKNGKKVPIRLVLRYDTFDPYAVTFSFGKYSSDWVFGRELLVAGLEEGCGEGDVRIRPSTTPGRTVIELESPDGYALLDSSTRQLEEFLDCINEIVPLGCEAAFFQIDDELLTWLG